MRLGASGDITPRHARVLLGRRAVTHCPTDASSPRPTRTRSWWGKTSWALQRILGEPYQVGFDNGDSTWRWLFVPARLGASAVSKDLIVRFNADGLVTSYSFTSNFPDDLRRLRVTPTTEETPMPNITVQWYAGRTDQQKREITAAITDAMVKIGKTTADQVHIVFQDIEKANWGVNGKLASDK